MTSFRKITHLLLLTLVVFAEAPNFAFSEVLATEQRVALVMGNGSYTFSPLSNPVNDANAIEEALRQSGFEVIKKTNASKREMYEAIKLFGAKLRRGGTGLFYFAGHGVQVGGDNYLVPVGAEINSEEEIEFECINVYRVLKKMEAAGNRLNIVILDACRNNPFARSFRSSSRGLNRMDAPAGTLLAYATAPGDIAADGNGRNGLYTEKILKYISQPNYPVEQVFKSVRIDVMKETNSKQVPWESSSLTGDFYFNESGSTGEILNLTDRPTSKSSPTIQAKRGSNQAPQDNSFIGKDEGWVFLGTFRSGEWKECHFSVNPGTMPDKNEVLEVTSKTIDIHEKAGGENFFSSEKSAVNSIVSGTKVRVLKVRKTSFLNSYWAKVAY